VNVTLEKKNTEAHFAPKKKVKKIHCIFLQRKNLSPWTRVFSFVKND
jgi:hypothetical protein